MLTGRTYDNQRYSPLTQVNASNVTSLQLVGIAQTGMTASFETTPIVVNGVMYITTPTVDNKMKIIAMDATNGRRIWDSTYSLGAFQICCGPVNRGPAVGYGMVYALTLDDKLLALDATTGKLRWQSTVADPSVGYSETMTPQVYDGHGDRRQRGRRVADPRLRGGIRRAQRQAALALGLHRSEDVLRRLVEARRRHGVDDASDRSRAGVGHLLHRQSQSGSQRHVPQRRQPVERLHRRARRAHRQLKWGYQEIKHDVWDYDAVSNVVLFDVHVNGQTIPAAGEAGKVGWFYIVDRRNGKLIRRSDPYVRMSPNMFSQPTAKGVVMLPGANGGAEWSPPAYSPDTHYVYVLGMDQLMKFSTHPEAYQPGRIRLGSAFSNIEPHGVQDGRFVAIDTETGKIAWTYMTPEPLIGGALATAGNLVFFGEGNGWFDALDAKAGKLLWRYNLGAGVNAPPMTYEVNGQQYVAVAAGGNFQLSFPYGDTVAIFKLGATAGAK